MSDGEGEGVRGVALRRLVQGQKSPDHVGDLPLVGVALARDDSLHVRGRVLRDGDLRAGEAQENDAPGVAELGGRLRIPVEEERFHRAHRGRVDADHVREGHVQHLQPLREGKGGVGIDDTVGHVPDAIPVGANDSPPEVPSARIDAEDDHTS